MNCILDKCHETTHSHSDSLISHSELVACAIAFVYLYTCTGLSSLYTHGRKYVNWSFRRKKKKKKKLNSLLETDGCSSGLALQTLQCICQFQLVNLSCQETFFFAADMVHILTVMGVHTAGHVITSENVT